MKDGEVKFCPACGQEVALGYAFCPSCGCDFKAAERVEEAVLEEEMSDGTVESEAVAEETEAEPVQKQQVEPVTTEPVRAKVPVKKEKSGNGKKIGLLVGLLALALVGVYFFMNREPGLAGTYRSQAGSGEMPSVIEISEEERMSYTFEKFVDGMPYSLTMHFNLEPLGEESYVITETDGFYINASFEGTEDEVDMFIDKFISTYAHHYHWEDRFEIANKGSNSVATFSNRRMSAEEITEFELWDFENFVVLVRDGNLIVDDQLFVRAEEG